MDWSILGYHPQTRVAKLADAPDLGSGGAILRGSSPLPGTLPGGSKRRTLNTERRTPNSNPRQFGVRCSALDVRRFFRKVSGTHASGDRTQIPAEGHSC